MRLLLLSSIAALGIGGAAVASGQETLFSQSLALPRLDGVVRSNCHFRTPSADTLRDSVCVKFPARSFERALTRYHTELTTRGWKLGEDYRLRGSGYWKPSPGEGCSRLELDWRADGSVQMWLYGGRDCLSSRGRR